MKTNSESAKRSWKNAILLAITAWALLASPGVAQGPGGSNTQIQYNNSGAFGGIPSLTSNGTVPATATLSPASATVAIGLQLTDPVTTTGTNTDQYAPWISFSGHAFDVTDHTVDWQIGEASTNTDDGTGKPLHYLFFQHQTDGGGFGNHYITIDSNGNLSDGGGDAVCQFVQFNAFDKVIFGNDSEIAAFEAGSQFGEIKLAGAPTDNTNPRITWSSGSRYYTGNLDTALGRDSAGTVGVYTSYNGSTLGKIAATATFYAGVTFANLPASPVTGTVAHVTDRRLRLNGERK